MADSNSRTNTNRELGASVAGSSAAHVAGLLLFERIRAAQGAALAKMGRQRRRNSRPGGLLQLLSWLGTLDALENASHFFLIKALRASFCLNSATLLYKSTNTGEGPSLLAGASVGGRFPSFCAGGYERRTGRHRRNGTCRRSRKKG